MNLELVPRGRLKPVGQWLLSIHMVGAWQEEQPRSLLTSCLLTLSQHFTPSVTTPQVFEPGDSRWPKRPAPVLCHQVWVLPPSSASVSLCIT